MIPLHRPAFGVGAVLAAALMPHRDAKSLQLCEAAHARASGCSEAVWLPSARAGIGWALRAAIAPNTKVIGPAYTCSVVHEAMVRAGGKVQIIDAAADSFAMHQESLQTAMTGAYALVLSEPFGHTYDLDWLAAASASAPCIRIVDSAMAVPQPELFQRLRGNDFAVVSFGAGKNSYAGWGAMGFTRDAALASRVRQLRDVMLMSGSFQLTANRAAGITLRTAAQNPIVFSLTRKLWYQARALRSRQAAASAPQTIQSTPGFPPAWLDDSTCSGEWRIPSTRIDRGLSLKNLELAEAVRSKRVALARRYQTNLAAVAGVGCPPASSFALSHYTVRADARIRDRVKEELYRRGVYTISLWAFNEHLNPADFPNAHRLCGEVICLPLSPWMNEAQVDAVCAKLKSVVAQVSA